MSAQDERSRGGPSRRTNPHIKRRTVLSLNDSEVDRGALTLGDLDDFTAAAYEAGATASTSLAAVDVQIEL